MACGARANAWVDEIRVGLGVLISKCEFWKGLDVVMNRSGIRILRGTRVCRLIRLPGADEKADRFDLLLPR